MMQRPYLIGLLALLCLTCDSGIDPPDPDLTPLPNVPLVIVNVNVVPMDREQVLEDQTVLIENGRIAAVGPAQEIAVPDGALRIEGSGKYLMPGLADMHTHVGYETDFLLYLAHGVTTILDMGHGEQPVFEWRADVAAGRMLAPTIYTAGKLIDGKPRDSESFSIVSTPEEARTAVREQKAQGVDVIKVYNDLSKEAFEAVVDEARQLDLAVVGHGVRAVGLGRSLQVGQVMIAHGEEVFYTYFGSQINPQQISLAVQLFKQYGAYLTPNLSTFTRVTQQWGNTPAFEDMLRAPEARFLDPRWVQRWKDKHNRLYANRTGSLAPVLNFLRELTGAMEEGGVPLILGTDSPEIPGMVPGASLWLDLETLVEAGLTPYEALRAGTYTAGRFVNTFVKNTEPFGTIAVGSRADLVLLNANPLDDIAHVFDQDGVIVQGGWLSREEIQRRLDALVASY